MRIPIVSVMTACVRIVPLIALVFHFGVTPAGAQELQKVTVRMDWVTSAYHAPFYVGVKLGFFKEQGLDVSVLSGNGSANVAQAIGNGNGEFATVDGGTMMQLVSKGLPVKAVMGWYQRNPNAVIYRKDRGINVPKDLEGKTLAVSNGDAPSALLPAFVKAAGIDISKITITNTAPAAKNAAAISGRADGVVTFAFLALPIINGEGVPSASFDFADYGVNVPGLAVIARTSMISQQPETIRKFVKGARKAIQWTTEHPNKAIEILVEMNPDQKIQTKTAEPILRESFHLLHSKRTANLPVGVMDEKDWIEAEKILSEYVGLKKVDNPSRYFTNDFAIVK